MSSTASAGSDCTSCRAAASSATVWGARAMTVGEAPERMGEIEHVPGVGLLHGNVRGAAEQPTYCPSCEPSPPRPVLVESARIPQQPRGPAMAQLIIHLHRPPQSGPTVIHVALTSDEDATPRE